MMRHEIYFESSRLAPECELKYSKSHDQITLSMIHDEVDWKILSTIF